MSNPGRWWIFQPRGHGRRYLTPLGLAWTLLAYLVLGLATDEVVRRLALLAGWPTAGPILLVIAASAGWTLLRVCIDGQLVRGAAWFTGIGWGVIGRLLTEAPSCGNLVFGAGLPGVSPGIAACTPHQDFMATLFVAGWVLLGPLAAACLAGLGIYRWVRRDPLHAYRYLLD